MAGPRDQGFRADDGIVLRTPLLPLDTLVEWTAAGDVHALRRALASIIDRPDVREALFVASPSLSGAIEKWRTAPDSPAGQRVESSLCKYVARMAGRSTPFGLFSAVSPGKLGKQTSLELAPKSEYRRRTRLDNDYLFLLVGELLRAPEVRGVLTWKPNTSIYRIAGRLRYAAARLDGKERSYHLVSVEPTEYLDATLARATNGAKLADLAAPLVGDDVTVDDANAYVGELVDAQLLVPELGVHVTGPEPIDGMIAQLRAAGLDGPAAVLTDVRNAIASIDASGVGNDPERYLAIAKQLETLPAKVDMSLLFQVDMVKPAAATLGTRVVADLAAGIQQLARLARMSDGSLDDFKRAFSDRWEGREIPLAEALDEESGIGFEAARGPGSEGSPLLAGLPFPAGTPQPQRVGWGKVDDQMSKRLAEALATGADEIALDDKAVDAMALDRPARLPDAFAAMFRVAGTADDIAKSELSILYEGTSGPSGARLLGRFCHASPEIDAMVRAHHAAEEAQRPDAIFAEIVHLNEGRIGNILCRPVLRAHEIVFLGVSGAPDDQRITLDDLLVSVRGDRIVLRSKRLGKEVIPRLTTAHNFRLRSLGVYRFLCALASQGVEHGGFSWGALGGMPYLPRVRIGRMVVARATWNLGEKDLAAITTAVREAQKEPKGKDKGAPGTPPEEKRAKILGAVKALRDARALPRFLVIAAGDNELPIDLDNALLAIAFADEVAGNPRVQLHEMFPSPDRLVAHGPEGGFADEVVVTFTRKGEPLRAPAPPPGPQIARRFTPGSEWLYAKLYCGESTGDRVLREVIAPVVREAMANGDADQWFFIRYADPDPHVRVRLHGDPQRLVTNVLPALYRAAQPLLDAGAVRKIMLDTYEREVERYGGDHGIELVERIFWHDSEAILGIVELLDGDAGADARWRLAVRGVDSLLDALGFDADARAKVASNGRDMLGNEFNANADFWARVGDRFTKERASLETVFARDPAKDAEHDLEPGFALIAARDEQLRALGDELRARDQRGELAPKLADLAWSLCHMHANRLLHASQRAQEMLLYDFVRRLHAARKARAKQA
ncbi:MAG TPA: lantibiotic dehydratase [Kofleriaceae bacterium]|nr:lantibiotic dehydratase [Kofleriaceae bacterium]